MFCCRVCCISWWILLVNCCRTYSSKKTSATLVRCCTFLDTISQHVHRVRTMSSNGYISLNSSPRGNMPYCTVRGKSMSRKTMLDIFEYLVSEQNRNCKGCDEGFSRFQAAIIVSMRHEVGFIVPQCFSSVSFLPDWKINVVVREYQWSIVFFLKITN